MKPLPELQLAPRVDEDIQGCLEFISRQPFGDPAERKRDILAGIAQLVHRAELRPVGARRPDTGRELRRYNVAQFAIIYAYTPPGRRYPHGLVSVRAVRHAQLRNVFAGVRDSVSQMTCWPTPKRYPAYY